MAKKPTIGDLLILAGEAANDPEGARREVRRVVKKKVKSAMQQFLDEAFQTEDDDEEPPKKGKR